MSAALVVDRVSEISQSASKAFLFNLNYLPDTILGGLVLFALLIQSVPLGILSALMLSLEWVHAGSSSFLAEVVPGVREASKDIQRCSGHFPGISFERLTTMTTMATLNNGFPSYYMMFFGALFGYMIGMGQTYSLELQGMPQKRAAVYSGVFIMGLLTIMFTIYRFFTGCDTILSVFVGLILGLIYGYSTEILIAMLSDRTLTNLMNIPLIRDRAEDGKPIYVCKKQ